MPVTISKTRCGWNQDDCLIKTLNNNKTTDHEAKIFFTDGVNADLDFEHIRPAGCTGAYFNGQEKPC
jgi:hypothetical protein